MSSIEIVSLCLTLSSVIMISYATIANKHAVKKVEKKA